MNNIEKDTQKAPKAEAGESVAVTDGAAFIMEWESKEPPEPVAVEVEGNQFLIRSVGLGDVNSIVVGQWREREDDFPEFDKLKTADRLFVMTIQQCVVNEDCTPFWLEAQVMKMFSGSKAPLYKNILSALYDECIHVNPELHPALNPTSHQRLLRWF